MSGTCATRRPAVVIMAKEPAAGRTKTRLCPPLSASDAAQLYEALLQDTIARLSCLRGVQLALACSPPSAVAAFRLRAPHGALVLPVDGSDIGACLSGATGHLFDRGFSPVIALASDGPTLPSGHIERAWELLEHHDVVFGPSEDGGYCLVGLRHPAPGVFQNIAWSTFRVTAQSTARAAALGLSVALLPPWYDVDTPADLERLRAELAFLPSGTLTCTRRFFDARQRSAEIPRGISQIPPEESRDSRY